mmetsp:Transcript_40569/g.91498  ORF Transcript_40569/g.91498 Transcript_40569/m.91498 type:complete len:162 (+) Transcript_40569:175-660(+)
MRSYVGTPMRNASGVVDNGLRGLGASSLRESFLTRPGGTTPQVVEDAGVRDLRHEEELEELLAGAGEKWVVVEFSAAWSMACAGMQASMDALARERPEALFLRVDVGRLPQTATRCGAIRVPAYTLFWEGKVEAEFAGASERRLRDMIADHFTLGPLEAST